MAVTLALLASPVKSAISPKKPPSPIWASGRTLPPMLLLTSTTPLSITKKLSPGLPSSMMRSTRVITRARSSGWRRLVQNSGSARKSAGW